MIFMEGGEQGAQRVSRTRLPLRGNGSIPSPSNDKYFMGSYENRHITYKHLFTGLFSW